MKLILTSILALLFIAINAQPFETDRLYNDYRGADGVVSIYIPGFLCRFAAAVADLDAGEEELLRTIRSIKILAIDDNDRLNEQVNFVEEINFDRINDRYQTLLEVHDGDEDVLIFAKEKNQHIRELTIVVGGDDNALVCIKGRMNRDLLYALTEVTGIEEFRYTKEL